MTMLLALLSPALAADAPTAGDAAAFVARVEAEMGPLSEYNARIAWVG